MELGQLQTIYSDMVALMTTTYYRRLATYDTVYFLF